MQITIFGASGKVGSLVVAQALKHGYQVVAFAHHEPRFAKNPGLRIIQGDIYNARDVANAVNGSAVIMSTLGSWGTPKKNVLTAAMQNIIPAMKTSGSQRIISLTGADARASGDSLTPMHQISHALITLVPGVRQILADGERHIELLEASSLDWTVVRSPIMNEHGKAGSFRLISQRPLPWATINRHSVASSLVSLIEDTGHNQQAPFIVRT
jgi:putative NADH-flavin reductase